MWIPEEFDPSATSSLPLPDYGSALRHSRFDSMPELAEWRSIVGISTAVIGNVIISLALNVQRYAHVRIDRERRRSNRPSRTSSQEQIAEERAKINARAPRAADVGRESNGAAHERSPLLKSYDSDSTLTSLEKGSGGPGDRQSYLQSPYWWIGIILMTVGEAGNFLAYGFAPASIVSPLGVVALVSNCLIAPLLLKERFRMQDGWGVVIATAGAVTVVLSAKQSETKLGPADLWDAISRWEFLTYVGVTVVVILALLYASPRYGTRTVVVDLGLVALFGGYTALATKGVASLLSGTLWMALTFPITYFLVAVLIASALMQIRYINRALQRFDSTQVIPTQFVLFTISVIIGSAVLYRDFESTTVERVAKFVGGCLLTFLGVYLITSGRSQDSDEEHDGDDDDGNDTADAARDTVSGRGAEGINLVDEERDHQDHPRLETYRSRDSCISPKTVLPKPRPTNRGYSDLAPAMHSPLPQTPYTPSPLAFSTAMSSPPVEAESEWEDHWRPHPDRDSDMTPEITQRRPPSPGQPSPFTRAQSGPPRTPTFARIRSKQANQEADKRGYAAETALRAHLAIRGGDPGGQAASLPTGGPRPTHRGSHSSFSRLLPGPLLSPLSSGLSAVVADSLRRGEGTGSVGIGGGVYGLGLTRPKRQGSGPRKETRMNRRSTFISTPPPKTLLADHPVLHRQRRSLRAPDEASSRNALPVTVTEDVTTSSHNDSSGVEPNTAKLQPMSDSQGDLLGRRRRSEKAGPRSSSSSTEKDKDNKDPSSGEEADPDPDPESTTN